MEDEVGKAAAVAQSQGYEVTALREPIKGLKGMVVQLSKTLESKQEPARAPVSFLISFWSQLLRRGKTF